MTLLAFDPWTDNAPSPITPSNPTFLGGFQVKTVSGAKGTQLAYQPFISTQLQGTVMLNWPTKTIQKITVNFFDSYGAKRYSSWVFSFNDGTTQTIAPPQNQYFAYPQSTPYVLTMPSNSEFLGFRAVYGGHNEFYNLQILYKQYTCSDFLTFSGTISGTTTLFIDHIKTQNVSVTLDSATLTCSGLQYRITVTSGTQPSLITIPNPSVPTIQFAASNNETIAGSYSFRLQAKYNEDNDWSAPFPGTYTYVNPCATTSFVSSNSSWVTSTQSPALVVPVGSAGSFTTSLSPFQTVLDQTTNSATSKCKLTQSWYFHFIPTSAVNTTVSPKFTVAAGSTGAGTIQISVAASTTNAEFGFYRIVMISCIEASPTVCKEERPLVSISCVSATQNIGITSTTGSLTSQTYQYPFTTQFSYALMVDTVTTCGHVPTAWSVVTTSSDHPSSTSSQFQNISANGLFTAGPFTDQTKVGTYVVTITSLTINGGVYTYMTTVPQIQSSLNQFTLSVVGCVVTAVRVVQASDGGNLAAQTYHLSATTGFTYALQVLLTPACPYTPSGWAVEVTGLTGTQTGNFGTITSSGVYSISPTINPSQAGNYTIKIASVTGINGKNYQDSSMALANGYEQLQSPSSFVLTVESTCQTTTVIATSIPNISLRVWQGSPTSTYGSFQTFQDSATTASGVANLCAISYSAQITTNSGGYSLSTFSLSGQAFQLYSGALNQIGTFTVTLTGNVTQFPSRSASTTFTITITDPCLSTILNVASPSLSTMTTYVKAQNPDGSPYWELQSPNTFTDSVSVAHGTGSGVDICGARVYSIQCNATTAQSQLTQSECTINSIYGLISIYTNNVQAVGQHTATVSVKLQNYSSVQAASQSFTIVINGCKVTSLTSTQLATQSYYTGTSETEWTVQIPSVVTQVPDCGYSVTGSVNSATLPNFITSTSGSTMEFKAFTRLRSNANTYNISIVQTLVGYTHSPIPQVTTVQTVKVIDSCLSTTIIAPSSAISNFSQFAGYNQTSSSSYSFNDSISQTLTIPSDTEDYCGVKTFEFSLGLDSKVAVNGSNSNNITVYIPENATTYQTEDANLTVCMQDYPLICYNTNFTITTLQSQTPIINQQTYTVGSSPLSIIVDPFQILPLNHVFNPQLVSNLTAYYLKNRAKISTQFDLQSQTLLPVLGQNWIDFNQTSSKFSVLSQNNSIAGEYTIILVQFFDQFPLFTPFIYFPLIILQKPNNTQLLPYFSPPLSQQTVDWCQGQPNNQTWKFQIPAPTDPYNASVTISVQLNDLYFDYNNASSTIALNKEFDQPKSQTITLKLKNELNISAQYDIQVTFKCQDSSKNSSNKNQSTESLTQSEQDLSKFSFLFGNETRIQKKPGFGSLIGFRPAWISEINQYGQVNISFFQKINVPQFVDNLASQNNQSTFRNLQSRNNLTLQQFIDSSTLLVQQKSQFVTKNLNWTCIKLTSTFLTI